MQLALAAQSEALLASTLIELHVRRHFVLAESFTFNEQDNPVVPGQRYMLPALDTRLLRWYVQAYCEAAQMPGGPTLLKTQLSA